ncbi:Uma2 family endonuclease [Ornithobacterium rhinotracheale]|uniref:Uma2 family endonuclease n=1 Tax=Ornithobacterium rhinotracheale TaxID=28251 RepID=A0A410JR47_ORNRH|nr:Uma2 family endonuclease [Ornithobacterium rhinotracheale]MRJ11371.1 Uma2 family endonuclease [Ornithobacterium rhinotracheale]QAR30657.1 Uma2 family endonuclease [Ornithobacterium rhinotracheale]
MEIKDINQLDLNRTYTYADYLMWKFQERLELIKGRVFKMSPAPAVKHQKISMNLSGEMYPYFKNKKCELFTAPFDVRLTTKNKKNNEITTVVQPDLCVICDPEKLDEKGCIGSPDLIVEILSPGNSKKEMQIKYELYEESGVTEYWVVRSTYEEIQVFVLNNGKYELKGIFIADDILTSFKFPDLKIDLKEVFK